MESKSMRVLLHLQHFEARTLQSRAESIGTHGNKRVADMNDPQKPVLKTVTAHEKTAGPQDAEHFHEDLVFAVLEKERDATW